MNRTEVKIAPGIVSDDTSLASKGRWVDGSNVRFVDGLPEVIGGWESLTIDLLTGVCRSVFQWTDNSLAPTMNVAFGTHSALQVWVGGTLSTITPTLALPAATLGASPFATSNGLPTIVVTQAGHPHIVGDSITISGATAVATVTINGTWTVTAVTQDTWTFTAGSNASATTTGGGSAAVATPNRAFAAGQIDGTGGAGFGTGGFGVGTWSSPSTADYFPRTWGLAAWGGNLAASPRGGTIYLWGNNPATPAAPIQNAPARCRHMLVSHTDQIFALGCNEEASGVYNPRCIRHSGVRRPTEWATLTPTDSTAREYVLPGGGEIVAGRRMGPYILVWTTNSLYVGYFTGNLAAPWRFDLVADNCGLIGPNAATINDQQAIWLGPDRQFRVYTFGGKPTIIKCSLSKELRNNISPSQFDKIVASTNSAFEEVRFDYPDGRDGYENSRYVSWNTRTGEWSKGIMARTAMVDAGPSESPIGVTYGGNVYYHERGTSADGSPFDWFIESGAILLNPNRSMLIRGFWPDVKGQLGAWNLTLKGRRKPNDEPVTYPVATFSPGDSKVDLRADARLFTFRWSGSSSPTGGRLGMPVFDAVPTSFR